MKTSKFYVIINKTNLMFISENGEETDSVFMAEHYENLKSAKNDLENFDEPQDYEIYLATSEISTKFELAESTLLGSMGE